MKRVCKNVRKKLPAFLNNQLEKEKARAVEKHLDICLTCRKEAEDLRLTLNLLEKYTIDKDFPDSWNGILERIEGEEKKVSLFQYVMEKFTLIPTPALCLLIFLIGITPGALLGKNLYFTLSGLFPHYPRDTQSVYSEEIPLDIFSDFPNQSLGDVYLGAITDPIEEE